MFLCVTQNLRVVGKICRHTENYLIIFLLFKIQIIPANSGKWDRELVVQRIKLIPLCA